MAALILISLFLASPLSFFLWQSLPLPKLIQFPWRFLALTCFAAAVFIGRLPKKLAVLLTVIVILASLPFFKTERSFYPESYYTTNDDSTTVKDEYNTKWLTVNIKNKPDQEVVQLSPTRIRVYKMYFPGLEAFVDGTKTPIDYQTNGLIELNVSPSPHTVTTRFVETPVHLFADSLTLIGLLICLVTFLRRRPGLIQ